MDGVLKYVHNYLGLQSYPVVATTPLPSGSRPWSIGSRTKAATRLVKGARAPCT